jgi:hypothetical protein
LRYYQYLTDGVPLHTSLKSRQVVGHASTHCHVPYDSEPRLPVEVGPVLPHILWLWTSPPSSSGHWCCHMSYGFGSRLSAEVGSSATTCPMALDLASWLRWASALPCVLWLRTSPPDRGGLRCYHVSHGSLWAMSFKHKEKPSRPTCAARHACSQCMHVHFQGASCQCHHAPVRHAGRQHSQYL